MTRPEEGTCLPSGVMAGPVGGGLQPTRVTLATARSESSFFNVGFLFTMFQSGATAVRFW
jgi:hypothetical protein